MGINTSDDDKYYREPIKTQLYEHLLNSELFSIYRTSFENITKHTVALIHPDVEDTPTDEIQRCSNSYCSILIANNACSQRCLSHTIKLSEKASQSASTKACSGGMTSTLIPVRVKTKVVAYLRTGQVRLSVPTISQGRVNQLKKSLPKSVANSLVKAFEGLDNLDEKKYLDQLVILGAFAIQLSNIAEKAVDNSSQESILTERCKSYISSHLKEKICLDTLASHTKVTNSYMCKQFKKHTGMTIVEYISVHRINMAKALLIKKSSAKVIDIAYECGFQSLSQFNRTFQKLVGKSPSNFRKKASSCKEGTCSSSRVLV